MGMAWKGSELWILRHYIWIFSMVAFWIPAVLPVSSEEFPTFTLQPESRIVPHNSPVTLKCSADPPDVQIRWLYNGRPLDERRHQGLRVEGSNLVFRHVGQGPGTNGGNAGEYRCTGTNSLGTIVSRPAILQSPVLHDFAQQASDVSMRVPPGGYVTMGCDTPQSSPRARVVFQSKDGKRLDPASDNVHSLPSGNVILSDVTSSDSGQYRCVAVNPLSGHNKTSPVTLNLQVDARLIGTKPDTRIMTDQVSHVQVIEGDDVILECPSYGHRQVNITWSKYGGSLPLGRNMDAPFGNLKIIQAKYQDTGTYKCSSPSNPSPFSSSLINEARVFLEVLIHPSVTVDSQPESVEEGERVQLSCDVRGFPSPKVTWFHNGQQLDRPTLDTMEGGKFVLEEASLEHSGIYQCMASNKLGTAEDLLELSVFEKSRGGLVTGDIGDDHDSLEDLDLELDNFDPKRKPAKKDRKKVGRRKKLRMRDKWKKNKGQGDKNKPKYAPSAPMVSQLSDRSVMINWTVPDKGNGQTIKFFKVQYKEMGPDKGTWQTCEAVLGFADRRFEVKDLKPDGSYKFRVLAVYEDDDNKNSGNSHLFKMVVQPHALARSPDSVPTIVEAKPVTFQTSYGIGIRWQLKTESSSPIEGFVVSYKPFQSHEYQTQLLPGASIRNHVIRNLLPNTSYSIRIQSFNSEGHSKHSNIVVQATKPSASTDRFGGGAPIPKPKPEDDKSTDLPPPPSSGHHSNNTLEQPVILGIVLGALLLALAILVTMCWWKQRQQKRNSSNETRKFQDQSQCIYSDTSSLPPNLGGSMKANGGLYPNMGNGHGPPTGPSHLDGMGGPRGGSGRGMNIDINPLADYDLQTMVHGDVRGKQYYTKGVGNGSLSRYPDGEIMFMDDHQQKHHHQLPPKSGHSIQHRTLPSAPTSPLSSFYSGVGSQTINHEYSEPHSERGGEIPFSQSGNPHTNGQGIPRSSSSSSSAAVTSSTTGSNAYNRHNNNNPHQPPPPIPVHSPRHNVNINPGHPAGRAMDFDWSNSYDHARLDPHIDRQDMETNPLLMYHTQQQQQQQQHQRYPPLQQQHQHVQSSPCPPPLYFQTVPTSEYGGHKSAASSSSGGANRHHAPSGKHKKRRKRPQSRDHHLSLKENGGVRDQATNTDLSSNEGTIEFTSFGKSGSSSNNSISNGDGGESDTGGYDDGSSFHPHHHHHLHHQHQHHPHHLSNNCDRDSSFANNGSLESMENRSSVVSGDYDIRSSQELSLPL